MLDSYFSVNAEQENLLDTRNQKRWNTKKICFVYGIGKIDIVFVWKVY
jgi:hypothetical protein